MIVTSDIVERIAEQFDVDADIIHEIEDDTVELELVSFGYPGGRVKEDFYRTDLEDFEGSMPHTNGTVWVRIDGANFVAHIRRISKHDGLKRSEEYHLLALHIKAVAFRGLDRYNEHILESLTERLDGVICKC